MSTNLSFIEFVCDQISGSGSIRYRKMFGEYMVYVNDKPLLLVCNNTVYVKNLEILEDIMSSSERGIPYEGSKEHYILDMDNKELCHQIIELIEPITSIPNKRDKKFMEPSMNNPVDRQDT